MKILGEVRNSIRGLVFDIDNTVYVANENYLQEGSRREMEFVAEILNITPEQLTELIKSRKAELKKKKRREVALTEVVYSLGITPSQWSNLRCSAWQPNKWIGSDSAVCDLFARLSRIYAIVFGTNSPVEKGEKILRLIGLGRALENLLVFGPENLSVSKPNPVFFKRIARGINLKPAHCLSIGDREFSDGPPAIKAGFCGAVILEGGRNELLEIGELLLHRGRAKGPSGRRAK